MAIINTNQGQYLRQHQPDRMNEALDPLNLDLSDEDLANAIDRRVEAANKFYESEDIQLKKKRKKNKDYLVGKQKDIKNLKRYQIDYVDNLIYEAESYIKPIALSRLPDLIVKPAKDSQESKDLAANLTKLVNSDIRKRENRKVLGVAWKHRPVYYIGVIKNFWDPTEGKYGDYKRKFVHPEKIVIDHTAATPEDVGFVDEYVDMSIQEMLMRWPAKDKEIRQAFGVTGANEQDKLASRVTIHEVWFKWWEKNKDQEDKENREVDVPAVNGWIEVNGVCWKYQKLILGKMKNPYWDWKGETRIFRSDTGEQVTPEEMPQALTGELPTDTKNVFNNYFTRPKFPYTFLTYDQWGEYPLDFTSRIEQSLSLQENHNKRGMQISDMNDRARGKHIFSTKAGLTKKEIEKLDMDNPNQDLVVGGPINEAHSYIQSPAAPQQLYEELDNDKNRLFAKEGVNSTTRGEKRGDETATGLQIYRQADFGRIDDEVEETINAAAEDMEGWALQFIKLFYTEEHMVSFLGPDGSISFQAFTRDAIEDGMEVVVSASGVDKMLAKQEAYERARMQLTDPLTFFTDVNASDPKGRAEKLMMFTSAPDLYLQKYVLGNGTNDMINKLNNSPVPGGPAQPAQPGTAPQPGAAPAPAPMAPAPAPQMQAASKI
jgi:hypothetical protein